MQHVRQLLLYLLSAFASKVADSSREVEENAVGGLDQDSIDWSATAPTRAARTSTNGPTAAATDGSQANKPLRQQAFLRLRKLVREPVNLRLSMPGGDAPALGTDWQIYAQGLLAS